MLHKDELTILPIGVLVNILNRLALNDIVQFFLVNRFIFQRLWRDEMRWEKLTVQLSGALAPVRFIDINHLAFKLYYLERELKEQVALQSRFKNTYWYTYTVPNFAGWFAVSLKAYLSLGEHLEYAMIGNPEISPDDLAKSRKGLALLAAGFLIGYGANKMLQSWMAFPEREEIARKRAAKLRRQIYFVNVRERVTTQQMHFCFFQNNQMKLKHCGGKAVVFADTSQMVTFEDVIHQMNFIKESLDDGLDVDIDSGYYHRRQKSMLRGYLPHLISLKGFAIEVVPVLLEACMNDKNKMMVANNVVKYIRTNEQLDAITALLPENSVDEYKCRVVEHWSKVVKIDKNHEHLNVRYKI